jgi:hypothetical protein
MKRNTIFLLVVLLTLTFAGSAFAAKGNPQLVFKAKLATTQVVPPLGTITDMEGNAKITFDGFMRSVRISLKIGDNMSGVTAIHLHLGDAGFGDGQSDIVINVKEFVPEVTDRTFTVLEVFIETEEVGSVNNIASLYQAVQEGGIYLDVHTLDYPNGEIRGQIFP